MVVRKVDGREDERVEGEKRVEEGSLKAGSSLSPKKTENVDVKVNLGQKESSKLWVDVIKDNRRTANGKALKYVAPKIVYGKPIVELKVADVECEIRLWETAVIMYVIGGDLSMTAVKNFMVKE